MSIFKNSFGLVALVIAFLFRSDFAVAKSDPERIVSGIYEALVSWKGLNSPSIDWLSAPERRAKYFSKRMVNFFNANDSYGDNLVVTCIDFSLAVNGNETDNAEIKRSLNIVTSNAGDRKIIEVRFTNFNEANRIQYKFIRENDVWKIDDIASLEKGSQWRLSEIPCSPKKK